MRHAVNAVAKLATRYYPLVGKEIRQRAPAQSWEEFLIHSSRVLEAVALGRPLAEATQALVELVEEHIQATMVTTMAADEGLTSLSLTAASQSMSPDYLAMIETAPIGPYGTCARAAFDGKVVVHPVNADTEDWAAARELIDRFNFQASWSFPLYDTESTLVGTLGLYFGEFRSPSEGERQLLERAAQLGGIILSQHRAAAARRRSERRFHELVESIPEGVLSLNTEGRTEFASRRASALALVEEPLGQSLSELFGLSEQHQAELLAGEAIGLQVGDRWVHFRATATADGAVVVVRDATEERALQEQLVHADRMATVGTLAAGVAHEINNPLMAITLNLQLLGGVTTTSFEAARLLDDARVGATRIAAIAKDLLSIARTPGNAEGGAELRTVVETALRLSRHQLRHSVSVDLDLPADLPAVALPQVHLGQVLMNLLINAAQAFPQPDPEGCRIRVTARAVPDGVELIVEDNGPGMSREVAARVFDPFFTTKEQGEGTGLGLAITRGLVDRAGGRIRLETTPGAGCRFVIVLPAVASGVAPVAESPRAQTAIRAMFVDDELSLLRGVERLMQANGHAAVCASSGEEALAHLERDTGFDVLLVDLMMPGMDGPALAEKVRQLHPELAARTLFMTGGAVSPRAREALSKVGDRWIRKPFLISELETAVRQIALDDDARARS